MGARRGLFAAIFAVTFAASFVLTGIAGFLDGSAVDGTRAFLAASPAEDAAVRVESSLAADAEPPPATVETLVTDRLGGSHVDIFRSTRTRPLPILAAGAGAALSHAGLDGIIVGSDPHLRDNTSLVSGSWPPASQRGDDAPVPATLQAKAADALGISAGDLVEVGSRSSSARFLITGTWLPRHPDAPYWFDDPAAVSGFRGNAAGPLVVAGEWPQQLSAVLGAPTLRFTVVPRASVTPDDLQPLAEGITLLRDGGIAGGGSVDVSGTLDATIARIQQGLTTAKGIAAIPTLLIAILGLATLAQLAGLVVTSRRTGTVLLAARGASVADLTVTPALEAAVVTVPAAALGVLASTAALSARSLSPVSIAAGWATAAAVAGVAILTVTVVAWRGTRRPFSRPRADERARSDIAATAGGALLIVAAAGLALRQFLRYGSVLAPGADGSAHLDLLAAMAPTLCLLALALVALLLLRPVLAAVQVAAEHTRGLSPTLPARQVARRFGVFAVAVLLVTLAVGGLTLTASLAATTSATDAAAGLLRNGSDVRVRQETERIAGGPASLISAGPYAALPGVRAAVPVLATPVHIADDTVSFIAMRTHALGAITPRGYGSEAAASALAPGSVGRALASTATAFGVNAIAVPASPASPAAGATSGATSGSASAGVDVAAWIADADGALVRLPLGRVALGTSRPVPLHADLPSGSAPWSVLAVDGTLAEYDESGDVSLRITGAPAPTGASSTMTLSRDQPRARTMARPAASPAPLPIVVTDRLADRLGTHTGDTLSFLIPATGSTVNAVVAGTVPVVAGTGDALAALADLRALNEQVLHAGDDPPQLGDVWIRTGHPASVARAAARIPHQAARVSTTTTDSLRPLIAPVVTALWWGTGVALVLAAVAVLAITTTLAAARRPEVMLLRALGVTGAAQSRLRLAELGSVLSLAFLLGAGSGALVAWLVVPGLARTAVARAGNPGPAAYAFAWAPWAALLGAFVLLLVVVAAAYAVRIRRQSAGTSWREDSP